MKKIVRKIYRVITYPLILSVLASYTSVFAQEEDADLGLSLSSLLNMDITVASDKAEKTSDAPGTVTAYSADDIKQFGYLTLRELAEFTPGYSVRNSGDSKQNWSLETRGGTASLNEKHLIRIDGIPVNHIRNNMALINHEFPLLFAERAEFLRGPASSLYGIGAFNGVINVVPKSLKKNGTEIETKFSLGSEILRDSLNGFGNYNKAGALVMNKSGIANIINKTDNQELQVSVGLYNKAPDLLKYEKRGGPDQNQRNSSFTRVSEKLNTGMLGDITLGFIGMESKHGYGTSWSGKSQPSNFQRWTTLIPYVKHNIGFNEKISLESYVKYNESVEEGLQSNQEGWWTAGDKTKTGIFDYSVMTTNWEGYTKLRYDITKDLSLLTGLNYDVRWQDPTATYTNESNFTSPFTRLYDKKSHTYSAFAQVRDELPLLKGLILTAGMRSDNGILDGSSYNQISPRLAAVLKITDELNLKTMYGTALKAPGIDNISHNREKASAFKIYNDTNTIKQVIALPELKSEVIQTLEGNVTYTKNWFYASATGFYNIIDDQLRKGSFTRPKIKVDSTNSLLADTTERMLIELPDHWLNAQKQQKSYGAELEGQVFFTKALRMWLNGSYTKTEDEKEHSLAFIPSYKYNLGVNYNFPIGLNAFAIFKVIPEFTLPTVTDPDSTVAGLNIIDINLTQKLSKNVTAGLSLANLLDDDYNQSVSESYPGRTITISLNTQF